MPRTMIAMTSSFLLLLLCACASFSEKGRMEQFKDITVVFDHTLLRADYRSAADFIDPTLRNEVIDYDQYKRIKIVDCRTTRIEASKDHLSVVREVELQYFLVDRNILRSTRYRQQWHYDEEQKSWMMKNGLPVFEP